MKINNDNNTIVVGSKNDLKINKIILRELNILGSLSELNNEIKIKVRSTGKLLRAKVQFDSNKAEVNILDGENGVSPGQACVFYLKDDTGDKVLGGGWIDKTLNKNLST
jgi:tRNA-specific 2-thiouridylase